MSKQKIPSPAALRMKWKLEGYHIAPGWFLWRRRNKKGPGFMFQWSRGFSPRLSFFPGYLPLYPSEQEALQALHAILREKCEKPFKWRLYDGEQDGRNGAQGR